jgi:hypothetical protein
MNHVHMSRILLTTILTLTFLAPGVALAQGQTITSSELRDAIRKASEQKQKDLEQIRSFFAEPRVRDALAKGGIQSDRVENAVSTLDGDAIAKLAAQTSKIQNDFAAGALNNQQLTYVIIALATAVIILVAVAA